MQRLLPSQSALQPLAWPFNLAAGTVFPAPKAQAAWGGSGVLFLTYTPCIRGSSLTHRQGAERAKKPGRFYASRPEERRSMAEYGANPNILSKIVFLMRCMGKCFSSRLVWCRVQYVCGVREIIRQEMWARIPSPLGGGLGWGR